MALCIVAFRVGEGTVRVDRKEQEGGVRVPSPVGRGSGQGARLLPILPLLIEFFEFPTKMQCFIILYAFLFLKSTSGTCFINH